MSPAPQTSLASLRETLFGRIVKRLEELANPFRQVFILTHYRGLESADVAARLAISEAEVLQARHEAESRLYRSMTPLRLESFAGSRKEATAGLQGDG